MLVLSIFTFWNELEVVYDKDIPLTEKQCNKNLRLIR